MRWGEGRDHGAGRGTVVRRMYSFPTGVGKSELPEERLVYSSPSRSSSDRLNRPADCGKASNVDTNPDRMGFHKSTLVARGAYTLRP